MNDEILKIFAKMRFKFRSDSLKNWNDNNPILLEGEAGVVVGLEAVGDGLEDETEKIKFGDGVTPWKELKWWKGPKGEQGKQGEPGPQGIQGEKGDKGDRGEDAIIDPTLLQKKIEAWQPNTEYKVGDTVIGFYTPGGTTVELAFILVCVIEHISSGNFGVDLNSLGAWDVNILNANRACSDGSGNNIEATYATKEEVDSTVGNIETALDELHAYAQALIVGGAT